MMQGELYAMQLAVSRNLLIMSGDYQGSGRGAGRPDFDLDPANVAPRERHERGVCLPRPRCARLRAFLPGSRRQSV